MPCSDHGTITHAADVLGYCFVCAYERTTDTLIATSAEVKRLREALEETCRDITVIEATCDHVNHDHATAKALTDLYLAAKAALEGRL